MRISLGLIPAFVSLAKGDINGGIRRRADGAATPAGLANDGYDLHGNVRDEGGRDTL